MLAKYELATNAYPLYNLLKGCEGRLDPLKIGYGHPKIAVVQKTSDLALQTSEGVAPTDRYTNTKQRERERGERD